MTNRQNRAIIQRRIKLIKEFGGQCIHCTATEALEFAHTKPTELKGRGRGRKERVYDVIKHPDAYILLCHQCHKNYDAEDQDVSA